MPEVRIVTMHDLATSFNRIFYADDIAQSFRHGSETARMHRGFCPKYAHCVCRYDGMQLDRVMAREQAADHRGRDVSSLQMRAYWLGVARGL